MLDYGFKNYKVVTPLKGVEQTLTEDAGGILKTGNQLSPYTLSLKNPDDVTVMLEKNEDESKLSYRCDGKYYYVSYNGKKIGKLKIN